MLTRTAAIDAILRHLRGHCQKHSDLSDADLLQQWTQEVPASENCNKFQCLGGCGRGEVIFFNGTQEQERSAQEGFVREATKVLLRLPDGRRLAEEYLEANALSPRLVADLLFPISRE